MTPPVVAVVTSVHPAGDGRILHKQVHALVRAGFQVVYLAPGGPGAPQAVETTGAAFVPLRAGGGRSVRPRRWVEIVRHLRRLDPDVVHVHDPEFAILAAVARVRRTACDAIVNAAGLADATSRDVDALWASNALLPGVVAEVARRSGVRRLPVFPVVEHGRRPLPFALIDNVGAAVAFLAAHPDLRGVVLHPWEGVTVADALDWFARDVRRLPLPGSVASAVSLAGHLIGRWSDPVEAITRRLELLLLGQRQDARRLAAAGFVPPVGREGWDLLASTLAAQT